MYANCWEKSYTMDSFREEWLQKCIQSGSFTNHGRYIKSAEIAIENHIKNKRFVAIFGSKTVGTAAALWLDNESSKKVVGLSDDEVASFYNLLGLAEEPQFKKQPSVKQKTVFVCDQVTVGDLVDLIKTNNADILIVHAIVHSDNETDIHNLLDYAVIFCKCSDDFKKLISIRSSYGAGNTSISVAATLNARPSELIGLALLDAFKTDAYH